MMLVFTWVLVGAVALLGAFEAGKYRGPEQDQTKSGPADPGGDLRITSAPNGPPGPCSGEVSACVSFSRSNEAAP